MQTVGESFGELAARKRAGSGLSLRALADKVGVSLTYLCDIEKGRRNPPDIGTLDRLADALGFTEEERLRSYDLSGESRGGVSADLPEYIMSNPYIRVALRKAKDKKASEDVWLRLISEMDSQE